MTILYDSIPSAISNFKMAMLIGLHLNGHTTVFLRIKESLQMFRPYRKRKLLMLLTCYTGIDQVSTLSMDPRLKH